MLSFFICFIRLIELYLLNDRSMSPYIKIGRIGHRYQNLSFFNK